MFEIKNDKLFIDGCSAENMANKYGTPLMVISQDHITEKCEELRECFLDKYENTRAAYAGKAFLTLAMCKIIEREGLCLDVVSEGELFTAIEANFPPERIEFNGNNKSIDEIKMALQYGVGRIIIDNIEELELIEELNPMRQVNVLLRVSPGVDSHTHEHISTGKLDSKFGISLADEEGVRLAFQALRNSKAVNFLGFHFHIGSQLHENEPYIMATRILMELVRKLKDEEGYIPEEINIGGGFGIGYTEEEEEKPYDFFIDPVMKIIETTFNEMNASRPAVVIEPGRSIVGGAGITLYRVGAIKEIPGLRKYVSVDGGMTDNIRYALYGSEYKVFVSSENWAEEVVTVCGKCCESGDILAKDVKVKKPERGDLLAIFATGAYCYSMCSNYNKIPMPPVVLTSEGKERLIVKGQSLEELISRERF